jgi:SAM-dependent methyltransferase
VTTSFKDHFSGHAPDYRTFRPVYPPELFAFLASLPLPEGLVWDCGTGNGQAAIDLARHFARVYATDASAEQIHQAEQHPGVEYAVAPAERCPLPDHVASLVTVAQALHWFDHEKFYAEVRRVCRPGGFLAAWTYHVLSVNAAIDPVLEKLEREFVGPYWPPERALVDAGYRTIPFPFEEISLPQFKMKMDWDLGRVVGYINTWSSTKAFIRAKGFNPLERIGPQLMSAWGDPMTVRTVRWQFYARVGRIE